MRTKSSEHHAESPDEAVIAPPAIYTVETATMIIHEIKIANVVRLQTLCNYDSGVKTSFETGPVLMGGTLYFTTLNTTFAIDPETCKLRWKHTEPLAEAQRKGLGVNRGVAAAEGKVRGYDDGNVVAIGASSGKPAWSTPIANHANGETPSTGESTPLSYCAKLTPM